MTEEYKKRLVELAKEIKGIQEGVYIGKHELLMSKVNYLIGYIMALEEIDNDS